MKPGRSMLVRRGLLLSGATVAWDLFEGTVATLAGLAAASVALVGFGVDSFAEVLSALVVGARFAYEMGRAGEARVERFEAVASRVAGGLLLVVAAYVTVDALRRLLGHGPEPAASVPGMAVTAAALPVMGALAWAKLRTSRALGSRALRADAFESISCAWLAAATLAGLALNAAFGWWWADPAAGLALVPLIAREGLEGLRGGEDDED